MKKVCPFRITLDLKKILKEKTMSRDVKELKLSKGGVFGLCAILLWIVFSLSISGLFSYKTETVLADVQISNNPRAVRVGNLKIGSQSAQLAYLFLTGPNGNGDTFLEAWAPGNRLLFSVNTKGPNRPAMQELVDVTDLNGDGNDEIVGYYGGDACNLLVPVVYVYNGDGTLRWRSNQFPSQFQPKMDLGRGGIKIYDLVGSIPRQKYIVAVPNTFISTCSPGFIDFANSNPNSQGSVNFYDYNGAKVTFFVPGSGSPPGGREITSFPGVVVGDIDNSGDNEVVIIAKSRVLVFNQDGQKLYYKQFVDSARGFTDYSADQDDPDGSGGFDPWGGRRYGLYRLANIDTDPALELIMAGDTNTILGPISPGALYEAYNLPPSSSDGYLGNPIWSTHYRATSVALTPNNWPEGYQLGVPLNGINDIDGDGVVEIVVTEAPDSSGTPHIRVIDARNGNIYSPQTDNGICIDVLRWTSTQNFRDLVVYRLQQDQHQINRIVAGQPRGQYEFNGIGTFAQGGSRILQKGVPTDFVPVSDTGLNSGRAASLFTVLNGTTAIIEQNPHDCEDSANGLVALRSWTASGQNVTNVLNLIRRPGRVTNILPFNNPTNYVWVIETESNSCDEPQMSSNQVNSYIQVGSSLVPNGDLNRPPVKGSDTPGTYVNASWFLRNSNSGGFADLAFNYGPTGTNWIPISGDWNGDGIDTPGLYDPVFSIFFLKNTSSAGPADFVFSFGASGQGFIPIKGDWDGDGIDTVGLFNPVSSVFFLKNTNSPGPADLAFNYGPAASGWKPISGDWNGDGIDTIGLYNPAAAAFFLKNTNSAGVADIQFIYGTAGSIPLAGDWNGQ
jgi:hypothetical protein